MDKKISVGIIGLGYVGSSVNLLMKNNYDVKIFDMDSSKKTHNIDEVHACNVVFICVPTPMKSNGEQDLSAVYKTLENFNKNTIYVLKSTVVPNTTNSIKEKYPDIKIVFNPEFLTEKNWEKDTLNPDRVIIGGENNIVKIIHNMYLTIFPNSTPIYNMGSTEAELVKYMSNSFLATKVSFMNEFKEISDYFKLNWENIVTGFSSDPRIGSSHTKVPGPDGKYGYGGTCFPKDVNAIISFAKKYGFSIRTVEAGWTTNLKVRPEQDWKLLKGRAVSE